MRLSNPSATLLLVALAVAAPLRAATYGASMPPGEALPVERVLAQADRYAGQPVKLEGRITQVCQKTGCWVALDAGGTPVRVKTGHAFFIPKDATGTAVVQGTLQAVELSAEQAAHYTRDDGHATAPGREWQVLATSIAMRP